MELSAGMNYAIRNIPQRDITKEPLLPGPQGVTTLEDIDPFDPVRERCICALRNQDEAKNCLELSALY